MGDTRRPVDWTDGEPASREVFSRGARERFRMDHRQRYQTFVELHARPEPLIIGNAWDVASALVMRPYVGAIGMSSAATAAALGYPDDESLPLDVIRDVARRVVQAVDLPVSVDMQAGYSMDPDTCARNIVALGAVGVVGVNLEDRASGGGLVSVVEHVDKIRAVRVATEAAGTPVFINARTDAFEYMDSDAAIAEAVSRARRYIEAGAGGVFVPFTTDMTAIRALARAIPGPLNVLCTSPDMTLPALRDAGVHRVSLGSGPMCCAYADARSIYEQLARDGRAARLGGERLSYAQLQQLVQR